MSTVTLVPEVWARLAGPSGLITAAMAGSDTTVSYGEPANIEREALWFYGADVTQSVPTMPGNVSRSEEFALHGALTVRTPGSTAQEAVERGKAILQVVDNVLRPDFTLGIAGIMGAFLLVTKCTSEAGDENYECEWAFDIRCTTFI